MIWIRVPTKIPAIQALSNMDRLTNQNFKFVYANLEQLDGAGVEKFEQRRKKKQSNSLQKGAWFYFSSSSSSFIKKMKSSPSPSIVASISELYPFNMEWKSFQNKLGSVMLSLLVVSTIFILFILHLPNPFSIINNKNIEQGLNQVHPLLQNNTSTSTPNVIIPDESSTIPTPPTSSVNIGIQTHNQNPPILEKSVTGTVNGSIPDESSSITTPMTSSNSITKGNTTGAGNNSIPDESSTIATPPTSADSIGIQLLLQNNKTRGNGSIPNEEKEIDNHSIVVPECDLFVGKWVRDLRGPIYTNTSCRTLPDVRNCAKYGKDQGYVYWRWKPDGCELPRFDPALFLKIVRGKKLMFIGDSLARNMIESLLCLLSQAEIPIDTYKDDKDKHRTWYFPTHDFTLMVIWTEFLVDGAEIINNGVPSNTFNIHIDRMHPMWAKKLPELSYAIINGGNWFTRKTYIYRRGKLIGCVHCVGENIPSISVLSGVRMVFKAAFKYISKCKECGDLLTLLRTYSMSHFEHGSWLDGGYCNRTQPLKEEEVSSRREPWEFRKIQMEELERVKKSGKKNFGLLDVTKAMILRADAHPGKHWIAKQTNDCLHWCLPGAIDMWSELLLEVLKRST